jgi:electron transfer flavoprotein beta subunit
MRVLVCVKRVPAVAGRLTLTDDERALDTRYVGFQMGPHEECAVEAAVQLVEAAVAGGADGSEAVVLTLGPAEALEQLREAMAIGVARAIHLVTEGEEFDASATAAAITAAITEDEAANGPFDVILAGNEAADTSGYQVAVRVGRLLGRPVVTGVKGLSVAAGVAHCEQEAAGGRLVYEVPTPAVVAVLEGINLPRYPSVPGRLRAKSKPVAASSPSRPASQLEMVRLVVPETETKQAAVLGHGPEAAGAVVELLTSVGVL